jgi:hypothetical protein
MNLERNNIEFSVNNFLTAIPKRADGTPMDIVRVIDENGKWAKVDIGDI